MIQAEKGPDYVNLVWRLDGRIKGVNVYRDGRYLASVNAPNNVYNDYSGAEGSRYELIAYGHGTDEFSERTQITATNDELDPVRRLRVDELPDGRAVLNWQRSNRNNYGWRIYRNGRHWRTLSAAGGYKDEIFDTSPDSAILYEVEAFHGSRVSPRMGTLGPGSLDYFTATGRNATQKSNVRSAPVVSNLPATNARTRSLAATAERSSQTAEQERREFENARGAFGRAGANLAYSGTTAWMTAGVPVVGQVTAVKAGVDLATFIDAGLETRRERIEATAAAEKADLDLKAYQDCMASSCSNPPPSPNRGGGDRDDRDDQEDPWDDLEPTDPGGGDCSSHGSCA